MEVINRSDGVVAYVLPELNIRRVFNINEVKDIDEKELNALVQMDGGAILLKRDLLVNDKEWVKCQWPDVPIEYFWKEEDIKKCLLEDPLDLFQETLDYAPDGVLEIMKRLSWQLPLTDLNKIAALEKKLKFNVLAAIEIMKTRDIAPVDNSGRKRLR